MKKTLFIILFVFFAASPVFSQLNANRTANTRVSDALAMLPARDAAVLDYAMEDLVAAGKEGIDILTGMFGDVNNVPVNYALNGLAFYVTGQGRQDAREVFEKGILAALESEKDTQVKEFYLTLLAHAGTDLSVSTLYDLIADEQLSATALRTLASIDTYAAKQAVLKAMREGKGDNVALAYAAGDMHIAEAAAELESWLVGLQYSEYEGYEAFAGYDEAELKKAVYYGLARTGKPEVLKTLGSAAKAEYYADTKGQATAQYLYALKDIATTDPSAVSKRASQLMSATAKTGNRAVRLGAFEAYALAGGKDLSKIVVKAMDDPDRAYRNGMLRTAAGYANRDMADKLLQKAEKTRDNEVKADIIYFAGTPGVPVMPRSLVKYIDNRNDEIAVAAIEAISAERDEEVTRTLLPLLGRSSSPVVIKTAERYILASQWTEVPAEAIEGIFESAAPEGKVALLGIIGPKGNKEYSGLIVKATSDEDISVGDAAYKALANVSEQHDLEMLFGMLESAQKQRVPDIQRAIINAMSGLDPSAQSGIIRARMEKAGNSRSAYYVLLLATNEPGALDIVMNAYTYEDAAGKTEVIRALASWNDPKASGALYELASNNGDQDALDSYVRLVAKTELTPERKLLLFTKAMDIAERSNIKTRILAESAKLPLFQTIVFAGRFLDDADAGVRDRAARTVMDVALGNDEWYGPAVTELLEKASGALNNPDAGYQREGIAKHLAGLPQEGGYVSLFNGVDLTGWKGLVENPIARAKISARDLARRQERADRTMRQEWIVEDGVLVFIGKGYDNICTEKQYGDFEMYVDWMLYPDGPEADGGIYLRGSPQVQMWDIARTNVGAQVGSGGLYNNKVHESDPLVVADNEMGEWNTFYIRMKGERVTVCLNGELVVDNVVLENYWDRKKPIFPVEQIELQAHGTRVGYRNIYIKELPMAEPYKVTDAERAEGFVELFDGLDIDKDWYGNTQDYIAEDGAIVLYPSKGSGGNLYTKKEYGDFVLRFEFMLTPGANNGIGIRTPDKGDAAYVGMEIQVLDDDAPIYANLEQWQYHGSVYGIIAAKRGYLKPLGEWNYEEIHVNGNHIRVTLNGVVIVDGDIAEASRNGTLDGKDHPGLSNSKGHIAFLGHGSKVWFRNLRIKELGR